MLKYLLRVMLKQSFRNLLLMVGLLTLSTGLSTYVSANQNAIVRVNTTLDEHWRGAYDILVRPKDAPQEVEKQYGVVESNYLSVGNSGISVADWKKIEQITGVDVAAPVAAIGYLRNTSAKMTIVIPPQTETSLYRVSSVISSTNGYNTTNLVNLNQYYAIKRPDNPRDPNLPADPNYKTENVVLFATAKGIAHLTDGRVMTSVETPPAIWTLVVGIDPRDESQLTGLNTGISSGKYLANNDGYTTEKVPSEEEVTKGVADGTINADEAREDDLNLIRNPDGPNIPIIYAASTYVSLPTTIKVDKLRMVDTDTLQTIQQTGGYVPGQNASDEVGVLRAYLDKLNQPVIKSILYSSFDYGTVLKPMSVQPIRVDLLNTPPSITTSPGFISWDFSGTGAVYQPGAISYTSYKAASDLAGMLSLAAQPKPDAQTIITVTGETAFRSLPQVAPVNGVTISKKDAADGKVPFTFNEVGSYDLAKLPDRIRHPDPLTYAPLGIYQPPLVKLVRDANGNPLPGGPVTLHPTINPASFIPGPPLALTNIAAARFFRGDHCIDAIRVRVAGIDRYTPDNVKKVEAVAAEIIKATGLHVDIVAGSSPQTVLVYIPGSPDGSVAPLGYVEEQWTTLGAAASIQSGIDSASLLMLAGTGIAGLLYLISQSLLSTLSRRRELALLQAVGWRRRDIGGLVVGEAAILGLLGGLAAVALAILIAQGLGLVAPPEQAAGVGVVVFGLYVAASVGPALWVVRQPIAELLQRGEVAVPVGSSGKGGRERLFGGGGSVGWRGLAGFAWRNLSRRRLRAILAGSGVAIATTLLMLLSASLVALSGTLRVTLLGQFVGLEVQPYHYIMVGSALIISILAVADHLAVGVLERRHELALLQAVGWRAGAVRLSLLLEGIWLGLIGGLVGAGLAVGVALASRSEMILSAWWVIPVGMVVMLGLCSLSALYAILLTPRQQLISVMQQQR